MKFIKENFYDILRLYINQLGITIFSLVLYFAVSSIDDAATHGAVKAAVSVFSILFYFALIYTVTWDYGAKDRIRVDGGRMRRMIYKGALMGFLANFCNWIFSFVSIISYFFTEIGFFEVALSVSAIAMRFTAAMYIGSVQIVLGDANTLIQTLGFVFFFALSTLVSHFGYVMGMNEKKIFSSAKGTGDKGGKK